MRRWRLHVSAEINPAVFFCYVEAFLTQILTAATLAALLYVTYLTLCFVDAHNEKLELKNEHLIMPRKKKRPVRQGCVALLHGCEAIPRWAESLAACLSYRSPEQV